MQILINLLNVLLVVSSLFLIVLVLIQRGKGGGLAGAFGGAGGSSAFGTKAGDVFTRITIITAGVWIAVAMLQVLLVNRAGRVSAYQGTSAASPNEVPALPGADLDSDLPGALSPPNAAPGETPGPTNSGLPSAIEESGPAGNSTPAIPPTETKTNGSSQ